MEEYTGYREIVLSNEQVEQLYKGELKFEIDMRTNEYLVVRDEDEKVIKSFKCYEDGSMKEVPFKTINSKYFGRVKPRNPYQRLAIDMLYDDSTTVNILTGVFGAGKDFLMDSVAVDLIEHGKFEKIVYVRNNIEVKDSKPIGYLPGDNNDKLLPFAMPLADHLGGVEAVENMISDGRLEIQHLGFIRGRDFKNSIIICSEAENMTKQHIQLLIGRVGEGSVLWINGDFRQCDSDVFAKNCGLAIATDRLAGHKRFACVKLPMTERSETAAMADLLD